MTEFQNLRYCTNCACDHNYYKLFLGISDKIVWGDLRLYNNLNVTTYEVKCIELKKKTKRRIHVSESL